MLTLMIVGCGYLPLLGAIVALDKRFGYPLARGFGYGDD